MLGSRLTKVFRVLGLTALVLLISFSLSPCTAKEKTGATTAQENLKLETLAGVLGKAGAEQPGIFDVTKSENELFVVYHFYTLEQKDIDDDIGVDMGPKIRELYKRFKTVDRIYFDVDVWRGGVDKEWTSYCHFLMTRQVIDQTAWTRLLDRDFFKAVLDLKYNE